MYLGIINDFKIKGQLVTYDLACVLILIAINGRFYKLVIILTATHF